ncbi:MAG: hypothetical protein IPH31_24695 [Lewinellaceae bacterium]|nr:hypothetical protein [Lewinellaceae bacterium]
MQAKTRTQPTPIVSGRSAANYQRPFDPTLTVFSSDSLRIYFPPAVGCPWEDWSQS